MCDFCLFVCPRKMKKRKKKWKCNVAHWKLNLAIASLQRFMK